MFKRRFIPYVVAGLVVLVAVGYLSHQEYLIHQSHKTFMADADRFERFVPVKHDPTDPSVSDDYVYEVNGKVVFAEQPLTQAEIAVSQWIHAGKLTPIVEELIAEAQKECDELKDMEMQRVMTPDGKIHHVLVPENAPYEEGDTLYADELDPQFVTSPDAVNRLMYFSAIVDMDGTEHVPPDAYFEIDDKYERVAYWKKFEYSVDNEVSIAAVEAQVASGELDLSLSDQERAQADELETLAMRSMMLAPPTVPVSDAEPVSVQVEVYESEDTESGHLPHGDTDREEMRYAFDEADAPGGESVLSAVGSDVPMPDTPGHVPLSPSDLPDMIKPQSPQSVADLENQLTPAGIEAELTEGLSTNPADKAQQFIDQYGTEEGLRRLRESDPDAARRFEQGRRGEPTRSSPDGRQPPKAAP